MQKKKLVSGMTALACVVGMTSVFPEISSETYASESDSTRYFQSTFEYNTDGWNPRGSSDILISGRTSCAGKNSLLVENREFAWNGASYALDPNIFVPDNAYSFGVNVIYFEGQPTDTFFLKLQYTDQNNNVQYATVSEGTAFAGEWIQLTNNNYTIPKGASDMQIYVETAETTNNFYIDEAFGSSAVGAEQPQSTIIGDINGDGRIDAFDLVLERKAVIDTFSGGTVSKATDIDSDGITGINDLVLLQEFLLEKINEFPIAEKNPDEHSSTGNTTIDSSSYMAEVLADLQETEPYSATAENIGTNYGTVEKRTYYSSSAGRNKSVNVLLPPDYNQNESYPVLYVLHGIFGNEDTMLDSGMKIQTMLGNLIASGEAEKMIVVFPNMFTSKTMESPSGFDTATTQGYDNFLYDIADDLMPFIENNYSVKTGRENTAITGFSMGGRESLYIGISRPDLFGYIGAVCPAPGVTPASDMFMQHQGSMQENEFRFKEGDSLPYMFIISAAANDGTVGNNPENYHNILTRNNTNHIWQVIADGDHGGNTVRPHMYNFLRYVFRAE